MSCPMPKPLASMQCSRNCPARNEVPKSVASTTTTAASQAAAVVSGVAALGRELDANRDLVAHRRRIGHVEGDREAHPALADVADVRQRRRTHAQRSEAHELIVGDALVFTSLAVSLAFALRRALDGEA